jgi:hypothetical protein
VRDALEQVLADPAITVTAMKTRAPIAAAPQLTPAIMQPIETWTRDVSAKGLFLDMAEPFAVGTRIKIVLELPAEVVGTP